MRFGRVLHNFQKMKYGNFLLSPYFFYRYLLSTLFLPKICIWCLVDITFGIKMIFLVKKWLLYWWFPINIRDFLQSRYFRDITKIVFEDSKSWKRFSSVKKFFAYTRFYWFFTHWLLYRYRNFDIVVTVAKIVQNLLLTAKSKNNTFLGRTDFRESFYEMYLYILYLYHIY